jgi:dTMP kinase
LGEHQGVFLVIDGIDGSGKTTHSKMLYYSLKKKGFDVEYTMEPSNSIVGRFIRSEVVSKKKLSPEVEALLFAADRFEHLKNEIIPWLDKGKVVVCDRYVYASIVYQGVQNVDIKWIESLNHFALEPDLAIYLDVAPEIGLERIKREKSIFENLEFQKRIRKNYLNLVEKGHLTLVDSNKNIVEVNSEILTLTIQLIESKLKKGLSPRT